MDTIITVLVVLNTLALAIVFYIMSRIWGVVKALNKAQLTTAVTLFKLCMMLGAEDPSTDDEWKKGSEFN